MNPKAHGIEDFLAKALGTASGRPQRHGIGDVARRQFAAQHESANPPLSTKTAKLAALGALAESVRLEKINPWTAADYRQKHAGAIASGHAIVNALQEASPERDVTVADCIALIEAVGGAE